MEGKGEVHAAAFVIADEALNWLCFEILIKLKNISHELSMKKIELVKDKTCTGFKQL